MALCICAKCGNKVSDTGISCPKCGHSIEETLRTIELQAKRRAKQTKAVKETIKYFEDILQRLQTVLEMTLPLDVLNDSFDCWEKQFLRNNGECVQKNELAQLIEHIENVFPTECNEIVGKSILRYKRTNNQCGTQEENDVADIFCPDCGAIYRSHFVECPSCGWTANRAIAEAARKTEKEEFYRFMTRLGDKLKKEYSQCAWYREYAEWLAPVAYNNRKITEKLDVAQKEIKKRISLMKEFLTNGDWSQMGHVFYAEGKFKPYLTIEFWPGYAYLRTAEIFGSYKTIIGTIQDLYAEKHGIQYKRGGDSEVWLYSYAFALSYQDATELIHKLKQSGVVFKKDWLDEGYLDGFKTKDSDYYGNTLTEYVRDPKEVVLPNNIEHIDSGAFAYKINISKIQVSDYLIDLDFNVLRGCANLREIIVPAYVHVSRFRTSLLKARGIKLTIVAKKRPPNYRHEKSHEQYAIEYVATNEGIPFEKITQEEYDRRCYEERKRQST